MPPTAATCIATPPTAVLTRRGRKPASLYRGGLQRDRRQRHRSGISGQQNDDRPDQGRHSNTYLFGEKYLDPDRYETTDPYAYGDNWLR